MVRLYPTPAKGVGLQGYQSQSVAKREKGDMTCSLATMVTYYNSNPIILFGWLGEVQSQCAHVAKVHVVSTLAFCGMFG